jgi:DNA-binding NtrC family response regulator
MESLLFGHVRGAFTGAVDTRKGLFEHAPGGTILLDEVDTLGYDVQAKLLRVLEERTIRRIGDRHDIPVDFRLISASNKDLREEVDKGNFREDLFFRLSTFPIALPPLRERSDDIPLLAVHFRDRFAAETGMDPLSIHECCMEWLVEYSWPGNVRELKNTIERATLLSMDGSRITCESLKHLREDRASISWTRPLSEAWSLERLEEEYLRAVMKSTGGHKGRAAEHLGIDRRTLYRKLGTLDAREASREALELPDHTLTGTLY